MRASKSREIFGILMFFVVLTLPSCKVRGDIITEPVRNISEALGDEYNNKYVFNIEFDLTSLNKDVQISKSMGKDGFTWEYEIYSLAPSNILTIQKEGSFSFTRENEAWDDSYFYIEEAETRQFGVGMVFTPIQGQGFVRVNLISGKTSDGEEFPIGIQTDWIFAESNSVVPEPSTFALIIFGVLGLLRKR